MSWIIPTITTQGVAGQQWVGAAGVSLRITINWRADYIPERWRDNLMKEWLKEVPIRHLVPTNPKLAKQSFVKLSDYNLIAKQAQALMEYLTKTWRRAVFREGWGHKYKPGTNPIISTEISPVRHPSDLTKIGQFFAEVPAAGWNVLEATAKAGGKTVKVVAKAAVKAVKKAAQGAGIDPDKLREGAKTAAVVVGVVGACILGGVGFVAYKVAMK